MKKPPFAGLIILFVLFFTETGLPESEMTVHTILKNKLDAVISMLEKSDVDQGDKNEKIYEIVEPIFDFPLMARLSLGRKHWNALSADKKDNFTNLFIQRLKESYLGKLNLYTDEKIVYKPPVQKQNKVHIPTDIISNDDTISMLYKFYHKKNTWKIYDIEIQGVSIIAAYRSQFVEMLQKGTIDDLLLKLKSPSES